MTKSQHRKLHDALQTTETQHDPQSGLPVCTDSQIEQRRSIIAAFEAERRRKRAR